MKALTLMQPYASLVIAGLKKIETRSWRTHYRGQMAIHAGGNLPAAYRKLCYTHPFARALSSLGHDAPEDLPRGVVLGTVYLVDCRRMTRYDRGGCLNIDRQPETDSAERAFGVYAPDRWAWVLADATPFEVPAPAQGLQRLWVWDETTRPFPHDSDCGCGSCEGRRA